MAAVGTANTRPERLIRQLLHSSGYRYRLHAKELPGRPDIVFRPRKKAIFVHGCFWHGHGCKKGRPPKSRPDYWGPKLAANADRDGRNIRDLESLGWKTLVIWQCETRDADRLLARLKSFVDET